MQNIDERVFGSTWFTQNGDKTNLIGSQCEECQSYWFPRRNICPSCFSENLKDKVLSNTGKVYSFTKLHVTSNRFESPLTIAYIDFPEGVRVCGQVEGDVKIGSKVKSIYGKIRTDSDGVPVYSYKFKTIS